MRVAFDARKVDDFGIGTYIQGLLDALPAIGEPESLVAYLPPGRPPSVPSVAAWGARALWHPVSARPYSVRELWQLALAARRDRADLYHAPHYVCPPWLPCPAVVTVHDLIHLRFPVRHRHPLAPLYARLMLRLAVRRAHRLITVSESTRRDLVERLGARPERIRVIPNGVGAPFAPPERSGGLDPALTALGVMPPYFLFAGNPLPHKNVARLLDAFVGLPPVLGQLVLVGIPPPARAHVDALCAAPRLGGRVTVLAPVSAPVLARLYQSALAVVCPSLWEGFGLAALEAMACGAPVLAANRGGLPEVVGDAGLLVDPTNVDALRQAMYTLADQEPLRAALRARGLARARAFSWRHVAEATVAVYREALTSEERG
ncbi:MAG TPA: glycosyltransferase family 1 protein [Methylomirabilota bacterium]|nr:glycosyltransferase family 1 protein [Methylomirabilota bacterium]